MGFEEIQERWHVIDGFENYAVTESGEIYSLNPYRYKGLRRLLKNNKNPKKYLNIHLSKDNKEYTFQIHRLVGTYFVDGYFDGAEIDHKDRNIRNNHYTNLEWVTHRENLHRSYSTMSPVRNFKLWKIIDKNGNTSPILKGHMEIVNYIKSNRLDIKVSMIEKFKQHNGYKMIEIA